MKKYVFTLIALLTYVSSAFSQIKIEGDREATVGYMLKLKLTLDVTDPQIKCFPENPDWIATKDFSGASWIIYVPGKKTLSPSEKKKQVTFVVAGNKTNKTYLETFELTVRPDLDGPDVPIPPVPDDEVTKSQLYKDLLAAYKVSLNAKSKKDLAQIYEKCNEDVKDNKFRSYKEVNTSLANVVVAKIGTDLTGVRDVVADYLAANLGTSGSAYDKDKLYATLVKVITALKRVPE